MPETTYTYSVSSDVPAARADAGSLDQEIRNRREKWYREIAEYKVIDWPEVMARKKSVKRHGRKA